MSQTCTICSHRRREEIDRALLSFSDSYRNIAKQFQIKDHTCLYRHLSSHLGEEYALAKRERAERTVTSIQEIAGSLAEIMRGDVTDLFDERGRFDLDDIRERNLGGLIKSVVIEQKREPVSLNGNGKKKKAPPADIIKVEMYSRLEAAKALGNMWVKLKINDDANRRTEAQRKVAEQNLQEYMDAGLSFEEAVIEVERDLPGARRLLNA